MYIKEVDFGMMERLHGTADRELQIEIDAGNEYVQYLKAKMEEGNVSLEEAVRVWASTGIPQFAQSIPNPVLAKQAGKLVAPYPRPGAFTEAAMNAIEHGTGFGSTGNVVISLRNNARSFLFQVTDPGAGFEPEKLAEPSKALGSSRGNGLISLNRCPALVNCERTTEGFRVAILYTLNTSVSST